MMVCMLDGSLPDRARPHLVELIDKSILADYIVPEELLSFLNKKSLDYVPTFEELLSVPATLVMESRAAGKYIGYRLWLEVKEGRFDNQWTDTLWTALLAYRT